VLYFRFLVLKTNKFNILVTYYPKPKTIAMSYADALKKIENHVNLFYIEHPDSRLFFHNLQQLKEVVSKASTIADHYQLDERSCFIICAAAWLHQLGYLVNKTVSGGEKSAELADRFLKTTDTSEEDVTEIKKCVRAANGSPSSNSLPEQILHDASTFYLGTDNFLEKNKLLKKETEAFQNKKIEGKRWRTETIDFFESHSYYTDYCRSMLDKTKAENLERLKNRQQEKLAKKTPAVQKIEVVNEPAATYHAIENTNGKTKKLPTRGIQTMFRISSSNSLRISEMADSKSHIMISVNSIIISVVLGLIIKNLDQNKNLIIPTIILLAVSVTTIIYSVLATRPKITAGVFTKEQLDNMDIDLLFFGNFYKMSFEEYDNGMRQMMNNREFLYGSLIKDIYAQAKVLGRKYELLHKSYSIFMYGIVVSVIAYAIAAFL
jgi:hypothetical protein